MSTSGRQVVIICGPPCAGKTTYVEKRRQPDDVVVDYDLIACDLGSTRTHSHDREYHRTVEHVIKQLFAVIQDSDNIRAWVIRSLPRQADRDSLVHRLRADQVVVLDEPDEILQARALGRPRPDLTMSAIQRWRETAAGIPRSTQPRRRPPL